MSSTSEVTKRGSVPAFIEEVCRSETDECIIWPFSRTNRGYGDLRMNGRREYAHQIICRRVPGEPPSPVHHAAHSCGNGHLGCVTPRHLIWKTPSENEQDKVLHGTSPRGERGPHAELTADQVLKIRSLAGQHTQDEIAAHFGVRQSLVSRIINRTIWKHI